MTPEAPYSAPSAVNPTAGNADRVRISEFSLNEKIMTLLKARPSCTDARFIMLELVDDPLFNWRIGHFDPGTGDRYRCKLALRAIHESLCEMYEMVGQS